MNLFKIIFRLVMIRFYLNAELLLDNATKWQGDGVTARKWDALFSEGWTETRNYDFWERNGDYSKNANGTNSFYKVFKEGIRRTDLDCEFGTTNLTWSEVDTICRAMGIKAVAIASHRLHLVRKGLRLDSSARLARKVTEQVVWLRILTAEIERHAIEANMFCTDMDEFATETDYEADEAFWTADYDVKTKTRKWNCFRGEDFVYDGPSGWRPAKSHLSIPTSKLTWDQLADPSI